MEFQPMRWISDLEMEDSTFFQPYYGMDAMDNLAARQWVAGLGEQFQHTPSSDCFTYQSFAPKSSTTFNTSSMEAPHNAFERPTKQLKTNSWNSNITDASSPNLLSFGSENSVQDNHNFSGGIIPGSMNVKNEKKISPTNSNVIQSEFVISQGSLINESYVPNSYQVPKRLSNGRSRSPSHTQDHILAERKRREKLSQRFIALSAIVPGLKKMDKASVLGDAIKYVKQLQEKVNTLENQNEKKTVESVVFVKRSHISSDDGNSSSDENSVERPEKPLPEIEVRVSNKDILIRIHCEKQKGILIKALAEMEQLHISVLSTSVIPFSDSSLDITVVAQMEDEHCMTVKDLVKRLKAAINEFMESQQ